VSTTKTQKGTSTNTATYGRQPGASSADIDALRGTNFQVDPTIGFRAGEAKSQLRRSFINPAGGYTTPQMRDAITRSGERSIDQTAGQESRAGQYDVNNQNYQKNAYLAALTAPPLVQTGSSGTQTGSYKTPFSAKIMPALAGGASAYGASQGGG